MNPKNLSAWVNLGDVHFALNDIKTAEEKFNYVIENGIADTANYGTQVNQAYSKLCGIILDRKKFEELVKLGFSWAKIFPNSDYPYLYIAVGYQGQGDKENACKYYKKVIQINPKNPIPKKNMKLLECE